MKIKLKCQHTSRSVYNTQLSPNGKVSIFRGQDRVETDILSGNKKVTFAPLYTNHRSDTHGRIYYRETFDPNVLSRITAAVNNTAFTCNHAFVATWVNVADFIYSEYAQYVRNTFQLVLASDGQVTYGLVFYYQTDSYKWALTGWTDHACNRTHIFTAPTNNQLEYSRYQMNSKVFLLTESSCREKSCMRIIVTFSYFFYKSIHPSILSHPHLSFHTPIHQSTHPPIVTDDMQFLI